MKVQSLGHIVLKVSDLARSRSFYEDLLGLAVSAQSDKWGMVFYTLGTHHNFALVEIGSDAERIHDGVGVDHFAFRLEGGIDELYEAQLELNNAGVETVPIDHNVSYSLYFHDPDGNRLEVYVDGAEGWREDPSLILTEATELRFGRDA